MISRLENNELNAVNGAGFLRTGATKVEMATVQAFGYLKGWAVGMADNWRHESTRFAHSTDPALVRFVLIVLYATKSYGQAHQGGLTLARANKLQYLDNNNIQG